MSESNFLYVKSSLLLLFLLFYLNCYYSTPNEENPEVQISLGTIKGSLMVSRLGRPIYSFRGIRYSKPPTGERRFKLPEPVDPWTGIYDASQEAPACPYPDGKNISEDCLTLNIYTTMLPGKVSTVVKYRPVIVFYHPGGWYKFSSQSFLWGPQYLLDQDVVLVVPNYRLGSLGFISTGDHYAPGNLAFKDQVLALRFVKDHIAAFGGDPNCVTISGQSAGSRSVFLHLVSPMSKGLFHRAIALSGSPPITEPLPYHQKRLAIKQANILNCTTETMEKMFACLREKPAKDFGDSLGKFAEWQNDPTTIWYPVIEPDIPGLERFLPAQPVDLLKSGRFNDVPVYAGVTRDEFGYLNMKAVEAAEKNDNSTFVELNKNWDEIAPISFQYQRNTDRSKNISRELYKYYFHGEPISLNNSIGRDLLYADSIVIFPVHFICSLIAAALQSPLYFYEFTYQGRYSWFYWSNGRPYGVAHLDDLMYLFYISEKFPFFEKDDPEMEMVERLTSMWAHFAKTGYPIPKNKNLFGRVRWARSTPESKAYLQIGEDLIMKSNLFANRMNLWEKLFPLKDYDYIFTEK